MKSVRIAIVISLATFCSNSLHADWNQWRGPDRTGEVPSQLMWPGSLSDDSLIKVWDAPLAEGYSSPVSEDGIIVTVATEGKANERVKAFKLSDGALLWETSWKGAMKVPFFAAKNGSWVRSTPVIQDGAVYIGGMRDVLVKLDLKSGEEIWRVDFKERHGTDVPSFGQVCSPLLDENDLYVQAGLAVEKLKAETGETVWRSMVDERAMFGSAFSSPMIAEVAGKRQLVVQARIDLAGLDLETGKQLWKVPVKAFRGMNILTPTVIGDNQIFTASYGGGAFLFEISQKDDGTFSIQQKWNNEKAEGYMGSPVVRGDHVYLHGRDKKFHCISLADGSVAWSTDEEFGEYWSMIYQEDQVLALDQKGELILFQASPDSFTITDRRVISEKDSTWAHLGLDGNRLLIRSLKGISVWEWK